MNAQVNDIRERMVYLKREIQLSRGHQRIAYVNRYRQLKREYRKAWHAA